MKIIDAHLHLFTEDSAEEMARQVGHHGTVSHLRQVYGDLNIVHGVVMGNYGLDVQGRYPADLFHYCVGLDRTFGMWKTPPGIGIGKILDVRKPW